VNFFGHAVVASRICPNPVFVLGAMMPDFESMVAATAARFTTPLLVHGIEAHHATDHVFHASERFLQYQAEARVELQSAKVRSGPRRAVAHVGVELLLDAALGTVAHPDRATAAPVESKGEVVRRNLAYERALHAGLQRTTLAGAPFLARTKLSALFTSLRARAAYVVPQSPEDVVQRLVRIFAHRPSLALNQEELPFVTEWAERAWAPIKNEAEAWLGDLVVSAAVRLEAAGMNLTALDRSAPPPQNADTCSSTP
jgi:hypothetical protein